MRPACLVLAFLTACGGGGGPGRSPDQPTGHGGELAGIDNYVPSYSKPELQKTLISERAAEATGERIVAELESKTDVATDDRLRVAIADLAVRRRFIAALEACEGEGRQCPPRLDDPAWTYDYDSDPPVAPPVTASLRFDLDSWRVLAVELHGRACACRTIACVESVGIAIDRLESKPMPEIQGDGEASLSVTRARECLYWLRGKKRR